MATRPYLSIGEVLTLLKDEFPDITISKIRFLESQGLLDPERTPSGYRKFYDSDVARLRWILRQQREHFLPLKVIKGRLVGDAETEGEGEGEEPSASAAAGVGVPPPTSDGPDPLESQPLEPRGDELAGQVVLGGRGQSAAEPVARQEEQVGLHVPLADRIIVGRGRFTPG